MKTWKPVVNADGKKGVKYREHKSRRHGAVPDRYYVLSYWWNGKHLTEAVGWASEKWTPTKCFELLAILKHNQKIGAGPCTLVELRQMEADAKDAERKRRAAEQQRNVSFKQFFEEIYLPDAKSRWKPDTTRRANEHVKLYIDPVTGETPFNELNLAHVNRIRAALVEAKRSARTQQYVFRTFAMVWNAAADHEVVSGLCPTKSTSFRLPRIDNERQRYLTIDEERKLLAEILKTNKQVSDIAVVALDAGLRFGEIAALTWGCVSTDQGILRVLDTKAGRDRWVPMSSRLLKLFTEIRPEVFKPATLVFPNSKGNVQTQVPSAFKRAVVETKLNEGVTNPKMRASFHSLRHTCASRMVQAGVDLYRVQRILGHCTPLMTARYSKLADDDLRQAIRAVERNEKIRHSGGKVIKLQQRTAAE